MGERETRGRLVPDGLRVTRLCAEVRGFVLHVEAVAGSARCPLCRSTSARVHSRYARTVADLPWRSAAVTLRARARRFFCPRRGCERRIFCERLPGVSAHARKTEKLEQALLAIALELGGRAVGRLRRVKAHALFETSIVLRQPKLFDLGEALGEDGWAKFLKLDEYAPRRARRPDSLQQVLFPYSEAI